jgi:membrane carboxypeptidase/penicillin-binding protein
MTSMLGDVIDRGTASAARRAGIGFDAGGKTGTTDDFKDAWFVGFSSSIVVGVWVGFDQPKTIAAEAYGSRYALPIWTDFMRQAARVRRPEEFERPSGLREQTLCRVSYLQPVDGCPVYAEYFKDGDHIPRGLCSLHRGSIRQRVARTIQDWAAEAGRTIRDIFR